MNLNKFAKEITLAEGKKVSLPIGQVKEVLGITLRLLKKLTIQDLMNVLKKV